MKNTNVNYRWYKPKHNVQTITYGNESNDNIVLLTLQHIKQNYKFT